MPLPGAIGTAPSRFQGRRSAGRQRGSEDRRLTALAVPHDEPVPANPMGKCPRCPDDVDDSVRLAATVEVRMISRRAKALVVRLHDGETAGYPAVERRVDDAEVVVRETVCRVL